MSDLEALAVIPCKRGPIVYEYQTGDIAVRVDIAADDAPTFFEAFQESQEPAFLSNGVGAIEATRGPIIRELADGGVAVKIIVAALHKRRFRELWPKPGMDAVLAREAPEAARERLVTAAAASSSPPPPSGRAGPYGEYARALRRHVDFMGNPDVWRAVGTDDDFLSYIRALPCARCKWTPHWELDHYVPCEAAHVRRVASGAGTSRKPEYSAIPLCPTRGEIEGCHAAQHRVGESFIGDRETVDKLRLKYVQQWVWESLKMQLGYESFAEIPPSTLLAWAEEHDLVHTLPDVYHAAKGSST